MNRDTPRQEKSLTALPPSPNYKPRYRQPVVAVWSICKPQPLCYNPNPSPSLLQTTNSTGVPAASPVTSPSPPHGCSGWRAGLKAVPPPLHSLWWLSPLPALAAQARALTCLPTTDTHSSRLQAWIRVNSSRVKTHRRYFPENNNKDCYADLKPDFHPILENLTAHATYKHNTPRNKTFSLGRAGEDTARWEAHGSNTTTATPPLR